MQLANEDAKDRRIAELEQRCREQATTITLLRHEIAQAKAAAVPRPAHAPALPVATSTASSRRPLAALQPNAQPAAQPPPAKKAKKVPPAPPLPRGWRSRPSKSCPGAFRFVNDEHGLVLAWPPTFHLALEGYPDLTAGLLERLYMDGCSDDFLKYDDECAHATFKAIFEDVSGLETGHWDRTPALKRAFDSA